MEIPENKNSCQNCSDWIWFQVRHPKLGWTGHYYFQAHFTTLPTSPPLRTSTCTRKKRLKLFILAHNTNQFIFQVFNQIFFDLIENIFDKLFCLSLTPSSLYTNHPIFSCNQSFKGSPSNSNMDGKTWATLPTSMSPSPSPWCHFGLLWTCEQCKKNKLGLSCAKLRAQLRTLLAIL